ncbi:MAG: AAA family ATPase [Microbacteriaceae bacterium]|nr:AAA family ATPase [Microbacteriaceae bacterium]MCL2793921.1 AAA family ATPase [Microbacteriaceae bacterium]
MNGGDPTEVLFIGGRAGVGKSTVALEVSQLLARADVRHAVIEGDNLDQAHPMPWRQGIDLAERNLAAMWRNYREIGWRRLVYTNTVSVLEADVLAAALGGEVRATRVLLTAADETARARLAGREIGSAFAEHVERSIAAARELEARADASVHRVATDGRSVAEIAAEIIALTGWCG